MTTFAGSSPRRRDPRPPIHRVAVVAFDGVVLGDLAAPCEVLGLVRGADGRAPYEVRVCSAAPAVTSAHIGLAVPWRLASLARADTVIVPGVDDLGREIPGDVVRAIRRAVDRGARVASICTGAFVLAATGALDGRRATTHWLAAAELARRHPRIEVDPSVLYVDHGALLTSAGAAAGFDLCLHLVRRDLGAEIAAAAARAAVMPLERAGGQAQFITHEPPAGDGSSLAPLLAWLEQNLRRELPLPVIAQRAAMSTRTLSRRFRDQVGTTPASWIAHARIRRAQRLLETTQLSVEQVAREAGFRSATVLREHFGQLVGTAPLAYRRAFATTRVRRGDPQGRHPVVTPDPGTPPFRGAGCVGIGE
jgi:transcriptional regulator GlxA family with amidase domain